MRPVPSMSLLARALLALALFAATSCSADGGTTISGTCPDETFAAIPAAHHKLDVLVVADTSARMANAWAAWNLRGLALPDALLDALRDARYGPDAASKLPCTALDRSNCALPDLRLGVVSADLGARGITGCSDDGDGAVLRAPAARCATLADPWLAVSGGQSNVTGVAGGAKSGDARADLRAAASCLLGTEALATTPSSCEVIQPLEAARRVLTTKSPGFLRDDAALMLLIVAASDDCSVADAKIFDGATPLLGALSPHRCLVDSTRCSGDDAKDLLEPGARADCVARDVPNYLKETLQAIGTLRGLRPARRLVVGVMAADGSRIVIEPAAGGAVVAAPACQDSVTSALPAPRLSAFAAAFGRDALRSPVCDDTPQLLATNLAPRLLSRCVDHPIVTDTGLACREDDRYGSNADATCTDRTLHLARCTVREGEIGTSSESARAITRCRPELFYAAADEPQANDCGNSCPCWRLVRDRVSCSGVDGGTPPYRLEVLRAGAAPAGVLVEYSCKRAAHPWGSDALGDAARICTR